MSIVSLIIFCILPYLFLAAAFCAGKSVEVALRWRYRKKKRKRVK